MASFAFMLCADDYGISPAVSAGIREALAARRLSATSAMTNMPAWPDAARDLAPFVGRVDLGLHLNLTAGAPLGPMPRFAAAGVLPPLAAVVRDALLGRLPANEIRAEIARQVDAFVAAMGRPPDFVDGHQHVQVLPGVRGWLLDDLAGRGWAGRVWLRDSSDRVAAILRRRVEAAKALQVAALAAGFARRAGRAGFACNRGFAGFSAFDARRDVAADFAAYIEAPGPRHLVMCHPGRVDAALAAVDQVTVTRERELDFLLSERFPGALAARGARLTRWNGETLTSP